MKSLPSSLQPTKGLRIRLPGCGDLVRNVLALLGSDELIPRYHERPHLHAISAPVSVLYSMPVVYIMGSMGKYMRVTFLNHGNQQCVAMNNYS